MPPRRIVLAAAVLGTAVLGLWAAFQHPGAPSPLSVLPAALRPALSSPAAFAPAAHHVFLTTEPAWHEEVWLCLGGMLDDMHVPHTMYTECAGRTSCIRFGLMDVAEKIGLWRGGNVVHNKTDVVADMNSTLADGSYVDTVVLATADRDLPWISDQLMDVWHARPADAKFRVVAVYHTPIGSEHLEYYVQQWAPLGALTFVSLSPHVAEHLKHRLYLLTAQSDRWLRLEDVQVRTVVPWMPGADAKVGQVRAGELPRARHPRPSRICVNGMISPERRAYDQLFTDMANWFTEDPALWGYSYDNATNMFVPLNASDPDTFKLWIMGERDSRFTQLPDTGPLAAAVEYVIGYKQLELYDYMASADFLLLAWNGGYRYLDSQASSSAFTSLETEVPLLITAHMQQSYAFLDPTVAVVKPHALSEMDSVMLFRRFPDTEGRPLAELEQLTRPFFPPRRYHTSVHQDAARMLREGWRKGDANWGRKKRALRRDNERVWREVLTDDVG